MTKTHLLLLLSFLLLSVVGRAQTDSIPATRTVKGEVTDENGEPLIGCSVMIEGTTIGTVADIDGQYSLAIPADGKDRRLKVAYVGYETVTVIIRSYTNTYNVRMDGGYGYNRPTLEIHRDSQADIDPYTVKDVRVRFMRYYDEEPLARKRMLLLSKGRTVRTDKNGYITLRAVTDADGLRVAGTNETVLVGEVLDSTLNVYPAPVFSHLMSNSTDTLGVLYMKNNMPESYDDDNDYALNSLKHIGDNGGGRYSLTQAEGRNIPIPQIGFTSYIDIGTVGKLPQPSSLYSQEGVDRLFRTGVSFGNYLNARMGIGGSDSESVVQLNLGQKRNNSIINHAYREAYNVSAAIKKIRTGIFETEVGTMYNASYGRLTPQGSNLSSLIAEAYTPLPPEMTALPRPDHEKNDDLLVYFKTSGRYQRVTINANASYDKLWNDRYNGNGHRLYYPESDYSPAYESISKRSTDRSFRASNVMANAGVDWEIKRDYPTYINGYLSYGYRHTEEGVNRIDSAQYSDTGGLGHAWSYQRQHNKLFRNAHDVRYGIRLQTRNGLMVEAFNNHYFSSTARQSSYVNLFPELGVSWNMNEFLERVFDVYDNQTFILYGSIKRSIGEAALISRNPAAQSTILSLNEVKDFYEPMEFFLNYPHVSEIDLKPETYLKSEIGLRYVSRRGNFSAEANFFNYNTHNYVAPIPYVYILPDIEGYKNIGRLRNYGYSLSATYHRYAGSNELGMNVNLQFTQARSKVTAVYGKQDIYDLAGFSTVQTVFAKDQSLGAIYALNNESYKKEKIGDPTPDFTLLLTPSFNWKQFNFSFALDYSHGGDRWNGTQALLEGDEYYTIDYSSYIQDASFLRCSHMELSYCPFTNRKSQFVKSVLIKAQATNLFVISPYKGVDPSSSLFGYTSGYGLDIYNLPATQSYILSLILNF